MQQGLLVDLNLINFYKNNVACHIIICVIIRARNQKTVTKPGSYKTSSVGFPNVIHLSLYTLKIATLKQVSFKLGRNMPFCNIFDKFTYQKFQQYWDSIIIYDPPPPRVWVYIIYLTKFSFLGPHEFFWKYFPFISCNMAVCGLVVQSDLYFQS